MKRACDLWDNISLTHEPLASQKEWQEMEEQKKYLKKYWPQISKFDES